MRAARIHKFGNALQIDEIPDPTPDVGEVLVDVMFAGVNPMEIHVTRGSVSDGHGSQRLPFVPGHEATVSFEDRIYLVEVPTAGRTVDGFYRERAAVPLDALIPIPKEADPAQAAALGIAGVTAWRAVNLVAAVQSTDRVLVLGAAGGVGSLAVQLAKECGAEVWGQTGNLNKVPLIESIGVDRAIVADATTIAEQIRTFNPTVVLDGIAGAFVRPVMECAARGARICIYGSMSGREITLDIRTLYKKNLALLGHSGGLHFPAEATRNVLVELLSDLADGTIRVPIDEILPLEQVAEAHRRILDRRVTGKLVLRLR